jgi:hypothetical protein
MILGQIVDQALQRSIAKKRGLKVSDSDIGPKVAWTAATACKISGCFSGNSQAGEKE